MLNEILGLIAAAGFIGYSIPQVWAIHKAEELEGYSLLAWTLLIVAIYAIQVQLAVSHLWIATIAQVFNTIAATYTWIQVYRKRAKRLHSGCGMFGT